MKTLTLWEPWASLIAIGAKTIETRSWKTLHRGPILIHASQRWTKDQRDILWSKPFREAFEEAGLWPFYPSPGCIVGRCRIVDCVSTEKLIEGVSFSREIHFGDYRPGRYGWKLTEPARCTTSFKGKTFLLGM